MFATVASRPAVRRHPSRLTLVLFGFSLVLLLLVSAGALAAYAWPRDERSADLRGTRIVGMVDDFEPGSVTFLGRRGIPAYLVRFEDGSFRAYEFHEPVFGCPSVWRAAEGVFRDPCHGIEYDIEGRSIPGNVVPATMDQFELKIAGDGEIRVDLERLIPGRRGTP